MTGPSLPGLRRASGLRRPALRVGAVSGVCLTAVMLFALVAANRVPWMENFAGVRTAVSYALFGMVMLVPVACFRRQPRLLFAAGMVGWTLFSLGYFLTGSFLFYNLFERLNRPPFLAFLLGGMVYGGIAAIIWVGSLLSAARHLPLIRSRHRHY